MPEMIGVFHVPSSRIQVPSASVNVDRTWSGTPWLRANSTDRSCSTRAPGAGHLEHLGGETAASLTGVRDDARIGAEDAGDVGVDLAVAAERGGQRDRGRVGAAAAQRRHVVGGRDALEAGDEHDLVAGERLGDAARPDLEDLGLGVDGVGHDAGLRAGERHRVPSEVVDGHRAQRRGDALAGREQHVHLARMRARARRHGPARRAGRSSVPSPRRRRRPAGPPSERPPGARRRAGSCRRRRRTCPRTSSRARAQRTGVRPRPSPPVYPPWSPAHPGPPCARTRPCRLRDGRYGLRAPCSRSRPRTRCSRSDRWARSSRSGRSGARAPCCRSGRSPRSAPRSRRGHAGRSCRTARWAPSGAAGEP